MLHKAMFAVGGALIAGIASLYAASAPDLRLIQAVKDGDGAAVRSLLKQHVDVNAAEADGTTALHWAAQSGNREAVEALVRAKAVVNARNRYGMAPIWVAATNGYSDIVGSLLRAGADPRTSRSDSGETVLMAAAMAGSVPSLEQLLAYGANPNAVDSVRRQTALMWAAAERHASAVRTLVKAGARLDARSAAGLTPLMFAIRSGDIDTTATLLDLGADMTATSPDGTTSLGLAIINAHWQLAVTLLDRGADPNGLDQRGRPLHMLAFMRRAENRSLTAWLPRRPSGTLDTIDLAKALLAHGAKINDRIEYKDLTYVPSHMALFYLPGKTYVGATALLLAAMNCDVPFVKFLLANGADPTIATVQKLTPLLAAAGVGYTIGEDPGTPDEALETVKLFAALGADLNASTDYGPPSTMRYGGAGWDGAGALHGAVLRGGADLVKWLIAHDVQLDRKTTRGETPLDLARGTTLGINLQVRPDLAEIIEQAMRAKGLPIPAKKSLLDFNQR
jgi:ankyrin repeat protein